MMLSTKRTFWKYSITFLVILFVISFFILMVQKSKIPTKVDQFLVLDKPTTEKIYRVFKHGDFPSVSTLEKMSDEELSNFYHRYLNSLQIECKEVLRLGNVGDGGWNICNDDEYRPRKNCTVISIGINNDFSFDDAIANEYGCMVYSFDPSMDKKDYRRSDHVQFYAIGLSANDSPVGNWKMNRLQTIKRKLGLSKIDVLKMDIEENEQTTITDMFANNTMDGVLQFVFEIHVDSNAVTKSKNAKTDLSPRRNKYLQSLANLRIIYNAGYRIFSAHQNPYSLFRYKKTRTRFTCHEISTIKIKLD